MNDLVIDGEHHRLGWCARRAAYDGLVSKLSGSHITGQYQVAPFEGLNGLQSAQGIDLRASYKARGLLNF